MQRLAVATIMSRAHGDVPFCLCGPPGTGKTLTLVESILHVHAARPTARILVAASIEPSSNAKRFRTEFDANATIAVAASATTRHVAIAATA